MRVRARARQRGVELPLVISDHADWDELTATIDETGAGEVWITHGARRTRWCTGADASGLAGAAAATSLGYEDEDDGRAERPAGADAP